MSLILKSLLAALVTAHGALAVGTPFGYGAGTTGGGNAKPAVPASPAQLASWLGDNIPRVILLDKTYDFTDSEGSVTGQVCKPWTCSPGAQMAIYDTGWCASAQKKAPKTTATWKKAGRTPIKVGSNKTLLGKGSSGWIKGKGIRISGSQNIIIQNVRFSDINAPYVWGGDGLTIDGGKQIWASLIIDHNYFKDIGRQFVVTGYGAAQAVTISNNVFDGSGAWSTKCDGHHWWTLYITGAQDTVTVANNYFYKTAGRGPRIGGTSPYSQAVHLYNNYWVDVTDHALDADIGSHVLVEGNYFNKVVHPLLPGRSGSMVFAPISASMAAQCKAALGRNCVSNSLTGSGALSAGTTGALNYFKSSAVSKATVRDPSQVAAYVQKNAGLGKVN